MNNYFSKCRFCSEKASAIKQPKGWLILDMSSFGFSDCVEVCSTPTVYTVKV